MFPAPSSYAGTSPVSSGPPGGTWSRVPGPLTSSHHSQVSPSRIWKPPLRSRGLGRVCGRTESCLWWLPAPSHGWFGCAPTERDAHPSPPPLSHRRPQPCKSECVQAAPDSLPVTAVMARHRDCPPAVTSVLLCSSLMNSSAHPEPTGQDGRSCARRTRRGLPALPGLRGPPCLRAAPETADSPKTEPVCDREAECATAHAQPREQLLNVAKKKKVEFNKKIYATESELSGSQKYSPTIDHVLIT